MSRSKIGFKKSDMAIDAPLMLTNTRRSLNHISGPYADRPTHREQRVMDAIHAHLHEKLRHKLHKSQADIDRQHGYVASEAAYHLLGGRQAGYKPVNVKHEGRSHWYLRHTGLDGIRHLDITHNQFETPVPHFEGKGRGFLTKGPSKRARALIADVAAHLGFI